MGLIWFILSACIATAIIAWFKFYYSTMLQAQFLKLDNSFTRSPALSGAVFFIVALISSPLLVLPTIVPSVETNFRKGIENVMLSPDA